MVDIKVYLLWNRADTKILESCFLKKSYDGNNQKEFGYEKIFEKNLNDDSYVKELNGYNRSMESSLGKS